jgi:selenocysteine lyase/cysteine desulfurase
MNLADRIAAGVQSKGYELMGTRTPQTAAGIVSFRKPGIEATEIVRTLKEQKIIAAPRAGWVRTSPHFYLSPAEIDRLIDALP